MDWSEVKDDFERDGALRDINVLDTGLDDWQIVLNHLRENYAPLEFRVNGDVSSLPLSVPDIFALHDKANTMLSFDVAAMRLNCFFFAANEIDFDLLPEDVQGQGALEALLSFIAVLGRLTQKVVVLSAEGLPDTPILRFDPVSDAVSYLPGWQ